MKHPFCISDSSRRFSPSFFVPIHISLSSPPSLLSPPSSSHCCCCRRFSLLPLLSCQLPRRQGCHGYGAAGQISWCLVSFRHVHKSLLLYVRPAPSEACLWSLAALVFLASFLALFFLFSFFLSSTRWSLLFSRLVHNLPPPTAAVWSYLKKNAAHVQQYVLEMSAGCKELLDYADLLTSYTRSGWKLMKHKL